MPGTSSDENLVFILSALKLGMVTVEQVERALDVCRGEPGLQVADVLVENGAITEDQKIFIEMEAADDLDSSETMASVVTPAPESAIAQIPERRAAGDLSDFDDASEQLITEEQSGRYNVIRQYAAGGQARILLTFDEHLRREVALKELTLDELDPAGGTPTTSQRRSTGMTRFLREARVTGMLEHPNIVPVHELGRRKDGTYYYTMRFVRGLTLAQKLRGCHSLSERLKLLGVFWDVCKAIAFAHNRGVVHRDIKPLNIMVGEFGETVVLDWGVAKVKGLKDIRAKAMAKELQQLQVSSGMTTAGMAIGTPSYMSPEQARGDIDEIDERSDVWGLGALLYEVLTGRAPYKGEVAAETMQLVQHAPLEPVQKLCPEVSPDLAAIAEKALQKDMDQRYQSAKELADEIGAYMTGEKVQAYEYSAWELIRRFVVRHKAAVIASGLMIIAVVAALLAARYMRIQELEREISTLAAQYGNLEHRMKSLERARKSSFESFDGDYFSEGEKKWREAMYLTAQLDPQYGDLWARLRGLLASHPESETGQALKAKLLKRLMTVTAYSGRRDISDYYRQLLLDEDQDGSFRRWLTQPGKYTVLSHPDGAGLSLFRFTTDQKGLVTEQEMRDLGKAPLTGLTLPQGSYLIVARHPDRETVRYPLMVERGEERVLSIPLPPKDLIPKGMVFIPPGEFLVGTDEQEEIRRHTGAVPRHRSYTQGLLISRNEVTFSDYLPFLREQEPAQREKYLPRGPYKLRLENGQKRTALEFKDQAREWGEKFEFRDCSSCSPQDWRLWPVAVGRKAAEDYAKWKTARSVKKGVKLTFRLPTEREWEKAARGADGRKYPTGETLPADCAVTRATHGYFQLPQEAGSYPKGKSVFDLNDLAGNFWEWVQAGSENYALKGGSFQKPSLMAMAASRIKEEDVYETDASGFRLAASLPGSDPCPLTGEIKGSQPVLVAQATACRNEGHRAGTRSDYDKSIELSKRALEFHMVAYGEKHSETASSINNVGIGYVDKGTYDPALPFLEKGLAIRLEILGPDHIDTAAAYNNLGIVYHGKSDFDKALEYYQKALDIRLKLLGAENPEVADAYYNIGIIYWDKIEYEKALEYAEKALAIYIKALGPDHPETGQAHSNVGLTLSYMGVYDQALESHKKALKILLEVLGDDDTYTADSFYGLGTAYMHKGQYAQAQKNIRKALDIYFRYLKPDHFSTLDAAITMGTIKRESGQFDLARKYFQQDLDGRLKDLGEKHPSTGYAYGNIGGVYCEEGSWERALEYYQKSEAIVEGRYGPVHTDSVSVYLQLAHLYRELGDQEKAAEYFEKTWTNGQKLCEKRKPRACANAAVARCQQGLCDQQTMALAEKGISISPAMSDTQEAMAFVLLQSGKRQEAKKSYCKVKRMGPLTQFASRKRVRAHCP